VPHTVVRYLLPTVAHYLPLRRYLGHYLTCRPRHTRHTLPAHTRIPPDVWVRCLLPGCLFIPTVVNTVERWVGLFLCCCYLWALPHCRARLRSLRVHCCYDCLWAITCRSPLPTPHHAPRTPAPSAWAAMTLPSLLFGHFVCYPYLHHACLVTGVYRHATPGAFTVAGFEHSSLLPFHLPLLQLSSCYLLVPHTSPHTHLPALHTFYPLVVAIPWWVPWAVV